MICQEQNHIIQASVIALAFSLALGACSTREGIDIDDPEISSAYEKHQEALAAYEEVAEVNHAWSTTADLIRLSYLALEDGDIELSLQYSATATQEAELAWKQHTQQFEYANVLGSPLRCATYSPELDCPGYAAYAELNAPKYDSDDDSLPNDGGDPYTVDPTTGAPILSDVSPPGTPGSTYVVIKGDSLWKISGKKSVYSDPFRWPLIFKTNASKIKDADLIFPKQRFNIFRGFNPADIDKAVLHARTRGAWIIGEREMSDDDFLSR